MAHLNLRYLALMGLASAVFFTSTGAMRNFNKRSDLVDVPPLSESGYTVPVEGGLTCVSGSNCTDALPHPSSLKSLRALAIARGVLTYDCTNQNSTEPPNFVSQNTQLYDAAPLVQLLPNEEALHQLVPELYNYDYTTLENSTLVCIGAIYTEYGEPFVVLNSIETFPIRLESSILPPKIDNSKTNSTFNADWAYSASVDGAWDVYRVETVGGAIPTDCSGQQSTFELGYASEYWFYHI